MFTSDCRLLISIHMNSVDNANAFGTETYYPTLKYGAKKPGSYQADSTAAKKIHQDLIANAAVVFLLPPCHNDRGIKAKNFSVIRRTKAKAILIEICFVSNFCQWTEINKPGDQALLADGIAAGVTNVLTAPASHTRETVAVAASLPQAPQAPPPRQSMSSANASAEAVLQVLQEDFEGGTFPPTGWTTATSGAPAPHNWHRTTSSLYVGNGTGSALVEGEYVSPYDEWLISPAAMLGTSDDALSFIWSGSQIWSAAVDASCNIRQQGTGTWTQLWSIATDEPAADPFIYRERIVDLSGWTGMTVEFGFNVVGTDGADFAIDDVVVGDFDPTATPANDVCTNATTLQTTFDIHAVTCYAANDLDPYVLVGTSCVGNELPGSDVFYRMDVAAGDTLQVSVTAQWGVGLYLIDDCSVPTCLAGLYAEDGRVLDTLEYEFPAAGTYYLVVDGEDESCGPYHLAGQILPTAVSAPTVDPADLGDGIRLHVLPNPSNGHVLLEGRVPAAVVDLASVAIYDVAGRMLVDAHVRLSGGDFAFEWDGRDGHGNRMGTGTYFVRVRAGSEVLEEKITLLR